MQTAETILGILNQKSIENPNQRFERLYRLLYNKDFYWNAYCKIASKEGNLIKVVDDDTIDGFYEKKIEKLIEEIRTERYYPKPARKKYIPKSNDKLRPLSIPSFSDKLVQEVIREILEVIYEPHFSENSHGFRPNKSCHTALYQIKKNWRGVKWVIEGDITSFFDNISHEKLLEILSRKIDDNRFLRLIDKFLKAGYMEDWKKYETYSGTPQGGILSPILANIYLNEFDKFIERICEQYSYGELRRRNPEYNKLNCKYHYYSNKGQMDKGYSRVKYCRYADDFVIGIWNDKATAERIRDFAKEFLENELLIELNQEKTLTTNLKDENVKFLGYEISKSGKHKYTTDKRTGFFVNETIQLLVPSKVVNKHIAKYSKNGKAIHLPQRVNQPELDTLMQYNAEIRGLYNYYSLATDVSTKINKVRFYNYDSLVKTLAFKHKCSYKKIIEKFGVEVPLKNNNTGTKKLLGVKYKTKEGEKVLTYFNESLSKREFPIINLVDQLPLPLNHRTTLLDRIQTNECELCGSKENIEVRHIKKLKEVKENGGKGAKKCPKGWN